MDAGVRAISPQSASCSSETQPRSSVEAFDDAEVALEAVGEYGQRLLVGRALVCGGRLFEAVELDQDDALGDSGFVCDDPAAAAGERPPACGVDGQTGQFVVEIKHLRVCDGGVDADPVALGHGTSSVGMSACDLRVGLGRASARESEACQRRDRHGADADQRRGGGWGRNVVTVWGTGYPRVPLPGGARWPDG